MKGGQDACLTRTSPLTLVSKSWSILSSIMIRFRESLDDDLFSQVMFMPSLYPPNDFGHFHKWKEIGINAVDMDCQVMDPAYFKAICPGRGDQTHWFEAQEAWHGDGPSFLVSGVLIPRPEETVNQRQRGGRRHAKCTVPLFLWP
ncbi:MAG: hypothetical protein QGI68_01330 [Pseudomonadales bacterium]|nr:hypothetical protein [Pseudomonadales bacterium]